MADQNDLQEKRVSAVLRDDTHFHNINVALDLVIRGSHEIVKEGLSLLSGFDAPNGDYELHYEWQGEKRNRFVHVVDGRLEAVAPKHTH